MEIQNKVAIITGTRRIGRAVAQRLAEKGADVALVYYRSKSEALTSVEQIRQLGQKAQAFQADLSKRIEVRNLVESVIHELGGVDILVNLASIYRSVPFEQLSDTDWDADLDGNLRSAFLCSQAVVPSMRSRGGGRIINFADWIAASGRPRYAGYLSYYVAKKGVLGLTEALALELAPHILVNAIAPGPILAPPDLSPEENQEVLKATPLGRWGGEIEIARTVVSLVESDFITGECIRVDGGRHIR
jgi:NAD(P)-dependent dehydrogenase (short-subunit alcohol dehydrogenase family)